VPGTTYLALIESRPAKRGEGPDFGSLVHLIREDAEASLCAIPRSSLTAGGMLDQVVCPACLAWFDKRRKISGEHKAIRTQQ
jgi:hypothetical protein